MYDLYLVGGDPLSDITPQEFRNKYSGDLQEDDLVTAFALSSNKLMWVKEHDCYSKNGSQEYTATCEIIDAWSELVDNYKSQIFAILRNDGVEIPETEQIAVLEPFMLRHNYIGGFTWWIKVAPNMVEARKILSEEQIKFICVECNISQDELMQLDEDGLYDIVYEKMCDIEIAEVPIDDTPESDRCIIASDIVTILGNALAMSEGYYEEQLNTDYSEDNNTSDDM